MFNEKFIINFYNLLLLNDEFSQLYYNLMTIYSATTNEYTDVPKWLLQWLCFKLLLQFLPTVVVKQELLKVFLKI